MKMNMNLMQTLVRALLKIGGGYAMAQGIADESQVQVITAGTVALLAVIWGALHRNKTQAKEAK